MKNFSRYSLSYRLKGVRCHPCFVRDHRCQAQMFVGEVAMCLACADGDPCIRERVAGAVLHPDPEPVADACAIPPLSAEDAEFVRDLMALDAEVVKAKRVTKLRGEKKRKPSSPARLNLHRVFEPAMRKRILESIKTTPVAEIAAATGFTKRQIYSLVYVERRKRGLVARRIKKVTSITH